MKAFDEYFLQQNEPERSTLLTLRDQILRQNPKITSAWKYKMPFFCIEGRMFCYLWFHKKHQKPYIGFVDGFLFDEAFLLQEKRNRMKIWLIDPAEDLPIPNLQDLVQRAVEYKMSK